MHQVEMRPVRHSEPLTLELRVVVGNCSDIWTRNHTAGCITIFHIQPKLAGGMRIRAYRRGRILCQCAGFQYQLYIVNAYGPYRECYAGRHGMSPNALSRYGSAVEWRAWLPILVGHKARAR